MPARTASRAARAASRYPLPAEPLPPHGAYAAQREPLHEPLTEAPCHCAGQTYLRRQEPSRAPEPNTASGPAERHYQAIVRGQHRAVEPVALGSAP